MSAPAPHHLPDPTEAGVLPEGIHDATLDQIQERFARFQGSTRRIGLFEKLKRYLEELRKTGWLVTVIVDGSFVMECVDAPGDIDIVLVFPAGWDVNAELKPFEYNLVSRKRPYRQYRIHVFPVSAGTRMNTNGWNSSNE